VILWDVAWVDNEKDEEELESDIKDNDGSGDECHDTPGII